MEFFLIPAFVLCIIAVCWFISHEREKARTAQFEKLAGDLELEFHAEGFGPAGLPTADLRLFNRGRGGKARNMLRGEIEGTEIAILDYRYVTGHGKDRRTHKQTVLSFQSSELDLPNFELRPEGLFHKIGQAFGYQDIDFPTHSTFSKRFLLRGEDEDAIRNLFTPAVLDLFESHLGISVEGGGMRMIIYRNRKRTDHDDVRSFLKEGFRFFELMKGRA